MGQQQTALRKAMREMLSDSRDPKNDEALEQPVVSISSSDRFLVINISAHTVNLDSSAITALAQVGLKVEPPRAP